MEEVVELLVLLGHWARTELERVCEPEEYVAHEVLFLRALYRLGQGVRGKDLARFMGWTPGRISQVSAALLAKAQVTNGPGLTVTTRGMHEASDAGFALRSVGNEMLTGLDETQMDALREMLRKMSANVLPRSAEAAKVGGGFDALDG